MPIPGRHEMNDSFHVPHALHLKKMKDFLKECYPEFAVIMDGTPISDKAECVMLRIVHRRTRRIHELVVHLGLYATSLDGASIAKNVSEALMEVVMMTVCQILS